MRKALPSEFVVLCLLLLMALGAPHLAHATGCGCIPISLPVGEQFKTYAEGGLRASYDLSYSNTDHYYIGTGRDDATETGVAPSTLGIEQVLGLEYDLAGGITLVGEIPFVHAEQSREFGGVAGTMKANGLGDVRLVGRYWLRRAERGVNWYGALGLSLPTGESDGKFTRADGSKVTKDLAAQAGTGNLAWIVELGGNRSLGERFGLGFTARYVITPSATTVNNFRYELTGTGEEKNSDSDAAQARVSLTTPLSTKGGTLGRFSAQALFDFAWVPYDDLIGKTEGFRRAGPILTAGPALTWAVSPVLALSTAVPFTLYRDIQRHGGNVQEWQLQVNAAWTLRPGGLSGL